MNKIVASDNKVFDFKDTTHGHLYAKMIFLGKNDSRDNYVEVDESVAIEYEQEQARKEKEEQLRLLLMELYPQDKEE